MNNFNFSIIEGNLVKDPTMTDNVLSFMLGSTTETKKENQVVTTVNSFEIRCEDRLAEVCEKYLKTGSKVLVSGKLELDNGSLYIMAKEINFLSPKP